MNLTRREWLTRQAATAAVLGVRSVPSRRPAPQVNQANQADQARRVAGQALQLAPGVWSALAQQAVDAATAAGAHYADARLTRTVLHGYGFEWDRLTWDGEMMGVGVRVLVNGYWGFASSPFWTPDDVVRLARDAVAQAKENAKGTPRPVDLGQVLKASGTWSTPLKIDSFSISMEEKQDLMVYWTDCAERMGALVQRMKSSLAFARQERVLATSDGAQMIQTIYESGARIVIKKKVLTGNPTQQVQNEFGEEGEILVGGYDMTGAGWELFSDHIFEDRIRATLDQLEQRAAAGVKTATIGRYTLVCDGQAMAALTEQTLGLATQLDRALGYEANAGGTSFIDDPLAMVGHLQVAAPVVTVTANRSTPTQLATVKWDDEGVEPQPFTLIKGGVLTDFQTTREQAAWLAPYYHAQGRSVRSNGCAAAEDAHRITMQHMPNLALEPNASQVSINDLIADVKDGYLVEGGNTFVDFQARNGLYWPDNMREIKNGKLGRCVGRGQAAVMFSSVDLWKNVKTVGGPQTQAVRSTSMYEVGGEIGKQEVTKGQPQQQTNHSVRAAAATITNQPIINPRSKA